MKKTFLITILLTISQIISYSQTSRLSLDVDGAFNAITVKGPIELVLIPSEFNRIDVEIFNVESKRFLWNVNKGTLNLQLPVGLMDRGKQISAKIELYYTSLNRIESQGANISALSAIQTDKFQIIAKSAVNRIKLEVMVDQLEVVATGDTEIVVTGVSVNSDLRAYLGAIIDGIKLENDTTIAVASEGAQIFATPSVSLAAKASLNGAVYYTGTPTINATKTIRGIVEPLNGKAVSTKSNDKSDTKITN